MFRQRVDSSKGNNNFGGSLNSLSQCLCDYLLLKRYDLLPRVYTPVVLYCDDEKLLRIKAFYQFYSFYCLFEPIFFLYVLCFYLILVLLRSYSTCKVCTSSPSLP